MEENTFEKDIQQLRKKHKLVKSYTTYVDDKDLTEEQKARRKFIADLSDLELESDKEDKNKPTIEDLIKQSLNSNEDNDFELPELENNESAKFLSNDEKELYNIGRTLFLDTNRTIDVSSYVPEKYMEEDTKEHLKLFKTTNKKKYEETVEILREETIFKAYSLYIQMEQSKYNDQIKDIVQRTYPEELAKGYFDRNNKMYGFNEDTMEISEANVIGKPSTNELMDTRILYKKSLTLEDLIDIAKDEKFISKLCKNCKDVRYKRFVNRCNTVLGYYMEDKTNRSDMNTVDKVPNYVNRLVTRNNKQIKEFNEKSGNDILNKSFVIALSILTDKMDLKSLDLFYPTMIVNNLFTLNMNGTKDISGSRKILFDSLKKFVVTVYEGLKNYDNK